MRASFDEVLHALGTILPEHCILAREEQMRPYECDGLSLFRELPLVVQLQELSEEDLIHILTQPKNAMIKQYQKLLAMDAVELEFDDDALRALVKMAAKRKTGARGLRAILEHLMLDVMYEVPQRGDIRSCRITRDVVEGRARPVELGDVKKMTA